MLLPILAVYLAVLAINYSNDKTQARLQAERHLTEMASHHATRLDGRFMAAEEAAGAVANMIVERGPATPQSQQTSRALWQRVMGNPALFGALVAFEPGIIQPKVAALTPRDPADAIKLRAAPPAAPRFGRYVYRTKPPRLDDSPAPRKRGPAGRGPGGSAKMMAAPPRGPDGKPVLGRPAQSRSGRGGPERQGDLVKDNPEFHTEQWYQRARTEMTPAWSEPRLTKIAGKTPISRYTVPLVRDGTFIGVIAFDISVQRFCDYVDNTTLEGGHCMLVSNAGLLVATPNKTDQMLQTLYDLAHRDNMPEATALADAMTAGQSGVRKLPLGPDGQRSWVVFSPVESPGWSFAAVIPEQWIMDPVDERLRSNMSIMLGGLGVIIAMVLLVSIRVTRPIATLVASVRRVARGDLNSRVEGITSHDEIREFADAFNSMVVDLKGHVAALTSETAARQAVESELRVARSIQASLLPRTFPPFPDRAEFDLHALVIPARQVAGDFFDFFFIDDDVLALLVADVSGKGAPAAIFMAMTRTVIRDQARAGASPADVLTGTNRIIASDNDETMFVTVFFAHYNTRTGELIYANAGHNPPCIGVPGSPVHRLAESTGTILGVFEGQIYTQRTVQMQAGQSLVLYTDGVTEALDANDNQFSLDRFEDIVATNPAASPEEITTLVAETVEQYRSSPLQDDVTLLALRRNT